MFPLYNLILTGKVKIIGEMKPLNILIQIIDSNTNSILIFEYAKCLEKFTIKIPLHKNNYVLKINFIIHD